MPLPADISPAEENAVARKNALLYAACQSFAGGAAPVSIALGGLTGSYLLGVDKSFATAPVTGFSLGMAIAAIPAAMLMQRIGRKYGFMTGSMIGIIGMLVACWAVLTHSFWLFFFGLLLNGIAGGFTQQFRFAATDRGTPSFRPKAISWVMVGGVAAAIIGPQLVIWTNDWLSPTPFAGAFLSGTVLFATSIVVLTFLEPSVPPKPDKSVKKDTGRPYWEVVAQPRFMVALFCGTASFALMSFVMTAAPLAMIASGFSQTQSTLGIQWHVMAMYAPSFFTGHLIVRFGKERIVALGLGILAVCGVVALIGIELANFWIALILLGIGWNFGFIGATAMVTDTYTPQERGKAQGINDMVLFGTVALSSLMSGVVFNNWGWNAVNWIIFPVVVASFFALVWLLRHPSANSDISGDPTVGTQETTA